MTGDSTPTLVIGNKNYSSWSLRAWLLLSAFNVRFREVRIPLSTERTRSDMARYTKAGRVPVLLDGDLVIWDSLAIAEYVNEKYLQGAAWPAELDRRARGRSAVAEMHSGFETLRNRLPMNCRATNRVVEIDAALETDIQRIDQLWTELRCDFAGDGPWLLGGFSIADCAFAPVASRFHTYGIELSETAGQYRDRLLDHPAMRLWMDAAKSERETIELEERGRVSA
jgi:glutathione S-transferase